ncbi:lipopolysaccharide biosynthesis protein [Thalassospira tepidiphila]|uniref:lipopolysaccharide biosynthesis protein n=1 Tax=Thalassospira tepidiphila TaxID=393657 RepID=UPI003AA9983A
MRGKAVSSIINFLKSDLGIRFIAEGAVRSSAFVVTPLLSWSLGANVFGGYLQIMSLSFAFVPLVSAGLGFTVIRQLAGQRNGVRAPQLLAIALGIVSTLCVLLAIILALLSDKIVSYFALSMFESSSWIVWTVPVLAWIFATEALVGEYLRALIKARASLYVQMAGFGLHMAGLGSVLWLYDLSLTTALLSIAIAKLIIIAVVLCPVFLRIHKNGTHESAPLPLIVALGGIPFMLAGLAEWAANLGDRLIVGRFLGPEAVAHYGAGIMMLSVIAALGAPVWWLLFPTVAKHIKANDLKACQDVIKHYTMLFIELALPVLALVVLTANPAISLLLNSSPENMTSVVLIAGCAIITAQVTTGWEYYLVVISSGKRLMVATITCSLIGFAVAWRLAPELGLLGVTLGMLSGKLALGLFYAISANRNGFDGAVWQTNRLALLCTIAAISVALTYAGLTALPSTNSKIGEIIIPALMFSVLYGAGRYLLNVARRRSNI